MCNTFKDLPIKIGQNRRRLARLPLRSSVLTDYEVMSKTAFFKQLPSTVVWLHLGYPGVNDFRTIPRHFNAPETVRPYDTSVHKQEPVIHTSIFLGKLLKQPERYNV